MIIIEHSFRHSPQIVVLQIIIIQKSNYGGKNCNNLFDYLVETSQTFFIFNHFTRENNMLRLLYGV